MNSIIRLYALDAASPTYITLDLQNSDMSSLALANLAESDMVLAYHLIEKATVYVSLENTPACFDVQRNGLTCCRAAV